MQSQYVHPAATNHRDKRNPYALLTASVLSLICILSLSYTSWQSSVLKAPADPHLFPSRTDLFLRLDSHTSSLGPRPPRIAYFISGSEGDLGRVFRLLLASYHPRNFYLLHLDRSAPQSDRESLIRAVQSYPVFRAAMNVDVIGNADFSYQTGPSSISSLLHGASILLRLYPSWDWFINLSAEDYPLATQDDLLHIFSFLPRQLNFINYTSSIGAKESRRMKLILVDPGFYIDEKTQMFYATQKRELPTSFRLYTGSSSAILSRAFMEFCIHGSDNFPRTLLMYLANAASPLSKYFPSLLCNSEKFNHTVVNHNLYYTVLCGKRSDCRHGNSDFGELYSSGAAFVRGLSEEDPVLDRIDRDILFRFPNRVIPGGWCLGDAANDTCSVWGSAEILRPTSRIKNLEKFFIPIFSNQSSCLGHCSSY